MLIKLLNIAENNTGFQHPLRAASFSKSMKVNSIYKMLLPWWKEFKPSENTFILKVSFESVPDNQIWNHYKKGLNVMAGTEPCNHRSNYGGLPAACNDVQKEIFFAEDFITINSP